MKKYIYALLFLLFVFRFDADCAQISVSDNFLTFTADTSEIIIKPSAIINLNFTVSVNPTFKINSATPAEEYFIPTELIISHPDIKKIKYNFPREKKIKTLFSENEISVYYGKFNISADCEFSENIRENSTEMNVVLKYQPCDEISCYAPTEQTINLKVKIAEEEINSDIIQKKTDIKNNHISKYKQFMLYLFFAFIGGLLLNVMPCVLPVLSIKILSLIKYSKLKRSAVIKNSLFYTLGILSAFLILAVIVIMLKISGAAIGWGFQFQNPNFLIFLIILLFFFSLSLAGVFIFNINFQSLKINLSPTVNLYFKSYLEGIFVTLLATPCTAPFLGSALGFAFAQPPFIILIFFLLIGLGLATPFFLLILFPRFLTFLPKQGEWMETLKQFLAFPMFAVVLWLLNVLYSVAGIAVAFNMMIFLLVIAFCCWWFGKIQSTVDNKNHKIIFGLTIIGILVFSAYKTNILFFEKINILSSDSEKSVINYNKKVFERYRADGLPVFLEFTADWCLTCQTNKKLVLDSAEIKDFFSENKIIHIRADWTNGSTEITSLLKTFGRAGVPLYIYYPVNSDKYIVLPELLTKKMILELK